MNGLDQASYQLACAILAGTGDMAIATRRADGSPHASTVRFASDGLVLFAAMSVDGHAAHDITGDGRVSLTVNAPFKHWNAIQGLSIDGDGSTVDWPREHDAASALLLKKFFAQAPPTGVPSCLPWPGMLFVRIVPTTLTLLDYTKRFGYSQHFRITDVT